MTSATSDTTALEPLPLPDGITSSYIDCHESVGLRFHILEAGAPEASRPLLLFIHGFPELAYSWRKVLGPVAAAGYYAVALDQRGYGRTTGWDRRPYADVDMGQFSITQLVRDVLALVHRLGRDHVDVVIGHDFGAVTAVMGALMRPDFFRACIVMSHPFDGTPSLPFGDVRKQAPPPSAPVQDIETSLALIGRKHYKWANSTPLAAQQWNQPAQGLHAFLQGYIYLKSAADARNQPQPLAAWTASALATMPHYYILKLERTMAETVAEDTAGEPVAAAVQRFLPDAELAVYVGEWARIGFQGALNWYRSVTGPTYNRDLLLFAGKRIDVPTRFVSGRQDWGNYQRPGALEGMARVCADFRGVQLLDGAGHWPQQEQPEAVVAAVLDFARSL